MRLGSLFRLAVLVSCLLCRASALSPPPTPRTSAAGWSAISLLPATGVVLKRDAAFDTSAFESCTTDDITGATYSSFAHPIRSGSWTLALQLSGVISQAGSGTLLATSAWTLTWDTQQGAHSLAPVLTATPTSSLLPCMSDACQAYSILPQHASPCRDAGAGEQHPGLWCLLQHAAFHTRSQPISFAACQRGRAAVQGQQSTAALSGVHAQGLAVCPELPFCLGIHMGCHNGRLLLHTCELAMSQRFVGYLWLLTSPGVLQVSRTTKTPRTNGWVTFSALSVPTAWDAISLGDQETGVGVTAKVGSLWAVAGALDCTAGDAFAQVLVRATPSCTLP
jgi:hypothetical protein